MRRNDGAASCSAEPRISREFTIDVLVRSAAWRAALRASPLLCRRAARATLAGSAAPLGPAELGIVLADDALLRALNRQWRGKDAPTNVLSFPAQDFSAGTPVQSPAGAAVPLGDVVLAFGTVAREAREQGKPFADHLAHLVVHGVLHLLGFDHEQDDAAAAMEEHERRVLAELGVPDPYRPLVLHAGPEPGAARD